MKNGTQQVWLFPNYFKKVGIGIFLVSTTVVAVCAFYKIPLQAIGSLLIFDALMLGLLIFSMAKDEIEDEFIQLLRIKAIIWAFFYIILSFILTPLASMAFGSELHEMGSRQIIFSMLFGYIGMFNYFKWKTK